MSGVPRGSGPRRNRLRFVLVLPFGALLYPPLYARHEPTLAGVPFFYWYQLAWVVASAALTYAVVRRPGTNDSDSGDSG